MTNREINLITQAGTAALYTRLPGFDRNLRVFGARTRQGKRQFKIGFGEWMDVAENVEVWKG